MAKAQGRAARKPTGNERLDKLEEGLARMEECLAGICRDISEIKEMTQTTYETIEAWEDEESQVVGPEVYDQGEEDEAEDEEEEDEDSRASRN